MLCVIKVVHANSKARNSADAFRAIVRNLLKCHYDENHIFSILHEKKYALYYFEISRFVPEIFKFLKYAN